MPYIQNAGRGNGLKTGGGLPSSLNSGSTVNTSKGNPEGYNPATSPLPNLVNKGGYEKTLDTTNDLVILRGGDKKEISRARKGSAAATEIEKKFEANKSDTNTRRLTSTVYLAGRKNIGMTAK
jgi:hypothetical protein